MFSHTHQATQNGIWIRLGLLKSGKSDGLMDDRTESQQADRFIIENDETNSYTVAESEMSLESGSFLHRVNDQVRKRQNQSSKDATKDSDKHSVMWAMFMSSTLESIYIHGKELLTKFTLH